MNDTKNSQKRSKCGACEHYRAMVYRNGEDAYCGRCMKPSDKSRRVRSAARAACDDFVSRGGQGHAEGSEGGV